MAWIGATKIDICFLGESGVVALVGYRLSASTPDKASESNIVSILVDAASSIAVAVKANTERELRLIAGGKKLWQIIV